MWFCLQMILDILTQIVHVCHCNGQDFEVLLLSGDEQTVMDSFYILNIVIGGNSL